MIDWLFNGLRWVTTRIDRLGRAGFNVVFPPLYITLLMAMAVGKCFLADCFEFYKVATVLC